MRMANRLMCRHVHNYCLSMLQDAVLHLGVDGWWERQKDELPLRRLTDAKVGAPAYCCKGTQAVNGSGLEAVLQGCGAQSGQQGGERQSSLSLQGDLVAARGPCRCWGAGHNLRSGVQQQRRGGQHALLHGRRAAPTEQGIHHSYVHSC